MKSRWGKDFQQRDLEATERRNVVIGEAQRRIEAERERQKPGWYDVWATRAWLLFFIYIDRIALALIWFLLGYIVSALR